MIALLAGLALAGPPDGVAGAWHLVRVESPKESWDYQEKVAQWEKYATDRCHEVERELAFDGDTVELTTRWACDEPGLGQYRSERSVSVEAQWNGSELILPQASVGGRLTRLVPPDATAGRAMMALLPGTERESTLGPATFQVSVEAPPPRAPKNAVPRLKMVRSSGETWWLEPVVPAGT